MSREPFVHLSVAVGQPVTVDAGSPGRRYIPIVGGEVRGGCGGRILAGGGDWQTICPDGRLEIEAHYILEAADGALVEVVSTGVRHGSPQVLAALGRGEAVDPSAYYFRTFVRLRTAAPDWLWLNHTLFVAHGARRAAVVELDVFRVE